MKKAIAFFDFDGTITTKDTLLEFIRFSKGRFRFYLGFLLYSPYLIAYKIKLIAGWLLPLALRAKHPERNSPA